MTREDKYNRLGFPMYDLDLAKGKLYLIPGSKYTNEDTMLDELIHRWIDSPDSLNNVLLRHFKTLTLDDFIVDISNINLKGELRKIEDSINSNKLQDALKLIQDLNKHNNVNTYSSAVLNTMGNTIKNNVKESSFEELRKYLENIGMNELCNLVKESEPILVSVLINYLYEKRYDFSDADAYKVYTLSRNILDEVFIEPASNISKDPYN